MKKVVIITGASSGIGVALVKLFAEHDYKVMAVGRNRERTEGVIKGLASAVAWVGDITHSDACDAVIAATIEKFGQLDVVVNNAGIIYRKSAEDTSDEEWSQTLAINLNAAFFLSRAAMPHLRQQRGAIINVASDWGLKGGSRAAAYCASKDGLVLMSKSMELDGAADGIRVNAICPGDVDTPMLAYEAKQRGVDYAEAMRVNNAESPTGRITRPDEVAALALYLASDAAMQITGAAIPIDGGGLA